MVLLWKVTFDRTRCFAPWRVSTRAAKTRGRLGAMACSGSMWTKYNYLLYFVPDMSMSAYDTVHGIALEQHGVFTAEQAHTAGVKTTALVMMARRERLERLAHGLYRDLGTLPTRWTPYMAVVLWPRGVVGVLSHATALDLMELSDSNPAAIHLTVPRSHRPRRRLPPPGVVLHRADLRATDVGSVEGVPITTAARTIRDCAAANMGPALVRQAIEDGLTKGWLTVAEADALIDELIKANKL